MKRKTPPFPNHTEWTTAKFWGFIRSGLREKFNRYPPKYNAIKNSAQDVPVVDDEGEPVLFKTGPRQGKQKFIKHYECAACKQLFKQKEVQVDHITPAGALKTWDDLVPFVQKLFCKEEELQIMCYPCHHTKTQEEKVNV